MVLFSKDHIQETIRRGRIEVIYGSMFSGKTEELIRRRRAKFARQRVEIFKPTIDSELINVCNQLANNGMCVIVARQ